MSRAPQRRITPTAKQMQAEVDAFNAEHKIGDTIQVFPGDVRGLIDEVQIADPGAYILGSHTPVVQVTGGRRAHGCIALTHVRRP